MKAVLDANVFVSATITSQGKAAQILDAWRALRFEMVASEGILEEIRDVLSRPHIQKWHQWTPAQIEFFLAGLAEMATLTPGHLVIDELTDDPDDNIYLACAVEGEADYIVSGDQHLLRWGVFRGSKIVTPAQFLAILDAESQSL